MDLRRSFALTAGVALLAAGLSSCGFDYATDQPYTPGVGTNNKEADIDVMSAVVVAGQDDSGTFIASFANPTNGEGSVTGIAGTGDTEVQAESFTPIEVAAHGLVNLADEGGIPVTGTFEQGDMLSLEVQFDDGSAVMMRVPVVRNCDDFEGLDETAEGEPEDEYACEHPEPAGH